MPLYYWGEDVLTSAHLINRLQSKKTKNKSPSELISQKFIGARVGSYISQRVFNYIAYLRVHESERNKLELRAKTCVFVGYSNIKKGHMCYHLMTQNIYIFADITFNEIEIFINLKDHKKGNKQFIRVVI